MCVAPPTELWIDPEIFVPDVVASNETDTSVHDDVLAVIPKVELPAITPFAVGAKCRHSNAASAPFLNDRGRHRNASHTIKEKADLDSFARTRRQGLKEPKPEAILPHNVELDENAALRPGDFGQDCVKRRLAIDQKVEFVSVKEFFARDGGEVPHPVGLDRGTRHLKVPDFLARLVNLRLMRDQGLFHDFRMRIEPAASKEPVERQPQPGKGDQPDHPGYGSLGGPDGKQRMHRAGDRHGLHNKEND